MTRSKMAIQAEESKADQKVEGFKQQLVDELALERTNWWFSWTLRNCWGSRRWWRRTDANKRLSRENKEEGRKRRRNKWKRRKRKKVEKWKTKEKVVEIDKKKGKSEANIEKKKEATPIECKEVPYPLVPSQKDKEWHLARFLDIFKKLEITLPFGEALQQMPLYAKFFKDMLTKKNWYIHSDKIVVEGNCSVVIQRNFPPKHKDPGVVTIPCSISEVVVGKTCELVSI